MKKFLIEYTYNGTSYYTKNGVYYGFGIDKPRHCKHIVKYKNIDVFSCSIDQYNQMGIACTSVKKITELKTEIARRILAPPNRVSITYNIDDDINVYFPNDLTLKY